MAFAAVTPIASVTGSLLTLGGSAINGAASFQARVSLQTADTRPQFGASWVGRKALLATLSMEGSINGYVTEAIFGTILWAAVIAGSDVTLVLQDETGTGKDKYSGSFILTELSKSNPSDGYVEFNCSFRSNGTIAKTDQT